MEDYFEPVSVEALRRVMGLDELVDADTLRRWFAGLNLGIANFGLDANSFAVADAVSREIERTIEPLVAELGAHPDDSMISHMLWAGVQDGKPRSAAAIMPSLKVILLGGMQEPGHAAGSTLHGLFSRPEQLALVAADPIAWAPLAVNEGLRWIAPIGAIERQATMDVEVGGVRLPAGAMVEVMIASANRDESHFDDPDVFDLERSTRTHQSFGAGDHFCAGHFFARQVERIMLEELFPALPGLRPDENAEPTITGWFFRAPKTLPVHWDEAPVGEETSLPAIAGSAVIQPLGTTMLEVVGMRLEADGILGIELRHPDGEDLEEWAPGAHIDLWASPGRAGQYSLCGDPSDRSQWNIAVLREKVSRGVSQAVHETLRPGALLPVGGPRNNFPLDPAKRYLFLAGGIGITALMPMIRAAEVEGASWELAYCGRSRGTMPFLSDLAVYGDRVQLFAADEARRLDVGARLAATVPGTAVYCCGPERMLKAVEREATLRGAELHLEHFTGVEALRENDRAFRLAIPSTGENLEVPADHTALEVLLEHGYDIRTACGEGNCGSCETRVLAGRIEHRDVLLTAAQRERGDRMMVCVSRALDGEIVLEL
jgi:ferredoxin-NADP reductase